MDIRGDGVVSLPEFRAAVLAQQSQLMQGMLRPVFDHIDVHGTGDISADEVVTALQSLGGKDTAITEAEAQALLAEFDLNSTGRLNFAEFSKMMSHESMSNVLSGRESSNKA